MQTIFSSIITFAIGLFFALIGLVTLLTAWFPAIRDSLFHFVSHYGILLSILGGGFLFVGISIIVYALLFAKRRYFYIRSGSRAVSISEDVAKEYITKYFQKLFGKIEVPCNLAVKRGKLLFSANLPFIPEDEQHPLTQKINSELSDLLSYKLGYKADYNLSISFEGQPKNI
jgi:hypothetical protein